MRRNHVEGGSLTQMGGVAEQCHQLARCMHTIDRDLEMACAYRAGLSDIHRDHRPTGKASFIPRPGSLTPEQRNSTPRMDTGS